MTTRVVMAYPNVTYAMRQAAYDVLGSRFIGQGPKVDEFEIAFCKKFKVPNATAVNSGTSALELAYDLIGIKPGDEVIVPVLTCTATNLPLIRRGAVLVFADVNPDTLLPDPDDIRRKTNDKTKAIVTVDLHGLKSTRDDFYFRGRRIPLVVDAAQALGNTGGDYTCYSFQAIKHITTGDGGMLVCKNDEDAAKAKLWRWFGVDRAKKLANDWQPYKNKAILFDIEYPGYKFQMTDIAAAMGIVGLENYDKMMSEREIVYAEYRRAGLPLGDSDENTYGYACLLVDDRDRFASEMLEAGIETNVMHVRNDIYTVFKSFKCSLPSMDKIDQRYICIPIHNKMTREDAMYVAEMAKKILKWLK